MTYAAFVALVNEHLTVDANRRGTEAFRARNIRNALIDLQRFIRQFRAGHTTTYLLSDMEDAGCGQRARMPDGATPSAFYIRKLETLSGPAQSGFDTAITSWADLQAIPTVGVTLPFIKIWIDSGDGLEHTTQLLAGTYATNIPEGLARPNDYGTGNERVWTQIGTAG